MQRGFAVGRARQAFEENLSSGSEPDGLRPGFLHPPRGSAQLSSSSQASATPMRFRAEAAQVTRRAPGVWLCRQCARAWGFVALSLLTSLLARNSELCALAKCQGSKLSAFDLWVWGPGLHRRMPVGHQSGSQVGLLIVRPPRAAHRHHPVVPRYTVHGLRLS